MSGAQPTAEKDARSLADKAPVPARVASHFFGTAGWTDPTLLACASFYPPTARTPADRLAHYASHFPIVEVDSTYYAIPSPTVARAWADRTPPDFLFHIKAHPVFTGHPIDRGKLPKDLRASIAHLRPDHLRLYPRDVPNEVREELGRRFCSALDPLREAGKLGVVMVQLPPWITATRGAARQIEDLAQRLPDVRVAVEFRHPSWLEPSRRERVFELLERNGLAFVCVDEPNVRGGGVPPLLRATRRDIAILRFHGHNVGGWRKGATVLERFDYVYAPEELRPWVAGLRRLADSSGQVHAVFNNCVRDFAVINAKGLAALVQLSFSPQFSPGA